MAGSAPDAQKLIALSFGKIQAARGQRGGVNLHRNLLVAGVIVKARSAYMRGIHHPVEETVEPEVEETVEPEPLQEEEEGEEGGEDCTDSVPPTEVSESCSPLTEVTDPSLHSQQSDDSCLDCDKENSRPLDTEVSCRRCTKRRLTEDNGENTQVTKKARVCHSVDSSTQCEPEPMQTDSAQISSLVHRFNSGLTGFLSCQNGQNQTLSDNECSGSNTTKDSHSVSCSTQIKEAFETLARPVVCALSV